MKKLITLLMLPCLASIAMAQGFPFPGPKNNPPTASSSSARNFPGTTTNNLDNATTFVSLSNSFTVALWVKNGSVAQTNAYLLNIYVGGTNQVSIIYGFATNQYQLYVLGGTGTNPQSISGITIADTNWHHIAYTYNGTTLIGYLDGTQQFSTGITFSAPASLTVHVGAAGFGGDAAPINAAVTQIVLATTPLTSGNITSLNSCTDATTLGLGAALIGYWKLNLGASPEIDSSSGGHNLTVTGTTTVSGPAGC